MTWLTALPPLCLVFLFFLNLLPQRRRGLAIGAGLIGTGVFAVLQYKDECARVNFQEQLNRVVEQQKELVVQQNKLLEQQTVNLRHEDERQEQLAKDRRELPQQIAQQQKQAWDQAWSDFDKSFPTPSPEELARENERANAMGQYIEEEQKNQARPDATPSRDWFKYFRSLQ
jgi:hypothetical protein